MHGPFLPIYGSGAILILFINHLSNGVIWKSFIFSIIVCTIMELCTGLTMEKLFKVRYWDYRNIPGNIKGYVAPTVSLFWGILSMSLNLFIHPWVSSLLTYVPFDVLETITYALTICIAVDFTLSFIESMDLRRTLEEIASKNKEIQKIKETLTEKKQSLSDNIISLKDYSKLLQIETKNLLNHKLTEISKNNPIRSKHALNVLRRNPAVISIKYVEELKEFLKHGKR
ncbi:MAG: hypothetical protein BKP49_07940 [Treponema sp. CETP13]|nr:MAG: hypothetical protein BKP49_07940 [Treponema sp. CETP13]